MPGLVRPAVVRRRLRDARGLILFATGMAFAAGVVAFLRHDATIHGMPLPLYTGLLYAGLVGAAATATSAALPALGPFVEATAIARLGAAVLAFGSPAAGATLQQSPLLGATVVVGGAVAIQRLAALAAARDWPALAFLPSRRLAALAQASTGSGAGTGSAAVS